jgi:hypothetical protein
VHIPNFNPLTLSVRELSTRRTDGHGNLISPKAGLKRRRYEYPINLRSPEALTRLTTRKVTGVMRVTRNLLGNNGPHEGHSLLKINLKGLYFLYFEIFQNFCMLEILQIRKIRTFSKNFITQVSIISKISFSRNKTVTLEKR